MENAAREFLAENLIPPHVCSLLEFYGVSFVHDLYEFGEEDVKEIEGSVREGTIGGQTDLNDASNLLKFLGSLHADYTKWSFRPIDRRKLLRLSDSAKKKLEEEIDRKPSVAAKAEEIELAVAVKAEPVSKRSARKKKSVVKEEYLWFDVGGAIKQERSSPEPDISCPYFGEPSSIVKVERSGESPAKKKRIRKPKGAPKLRKRKPVPFCPGKIEMYTDKAILRVNNVLNTTEIDGVPIKLDKEIDETHVKAEYDQTSMSYTTSVRCLLCDKMVTLSNTNYSVSASNYTRHLLKKHLTPNPQPEKEKKAERIIRCEDCGETFLSFHKLRTHKKIHRVKVHVECDYCEARYLKKFDLRTHMDTVHLGKKDHMCNICGKCFSLAPTLRKHMYVHKEIHELDEKRFSKQCSVCGFQTYNNQKLARHMKSHTGERNYECGVCGKRFLYDYNVTAHIRHVHNREKRKVDLEKLTCKFCGQRFQKIWKVKAHMAEVHKLIQSEEQDECFELLVKHETRI